MGFLSRAKEVKDALDAECKIISMSLIGVTNMVEDNNNLIKVLIKNKSQKNNLKILVRKTDELVEDLIPAYLDYRNNRETQRRFRFWVNGSELSKSQTASLFEGIGETIHDFKSLKESLKLNGPKQSVKKKTTNKKIAKKKIQKIVKKQNPKTKTKRK
jgi:hypothetical protein